MFADLPPVAIRSLLYRADSTSYCLHGTMADGTYTRAGSAASNRHPLGTRIRLTHPVFGIRTFTIRDHIGHGTELDLWNDSCSNSWAYGRRVAYYRVL